MSSAAAKDDKKSPDVIDLTAQTKSSTVTPDARQTTAGRQPSFDGTAPGAMTDFITAIIQGLAPLLQQRVPPPPAPPTGTPTSFAPASHLDTYPTPSGGTSARPPFGAALTGEVSHQLIHNTASVSGNPSSTVHYHLDSRKPATALHSTATTVDDLFAHVQQSIRPVDILLSDKPPASADAMEAALYAFLDSHSPLETDPVAREAIERYVRKTIQLLKLVDHRHVLAYHLECVSASAKRRYSPLLHGEVYPLAYTVHITPNARGPSRTQRDRPDRKRKAGPASADPSGPCDYRGHSGHTVAECRSRNADLRPQQGPGKRGTQAAPKQKPAAAPATPAAATSQ